MSPPHPCIQAAPMALSRPSLRAALPLCLLLAGCPVPCADTDTLCLVAEELPEALLSVRALAQDDVWVVGSEADPDASGPTAAQWDGDAWARLDTSEFAGDELWWVHPTATEVTLVGTRGLILHYDRATEALTRIPGPDPAITFFGVWGAGSDLWVVGGDISGALPPDIWRRSAGTWARFVDPVAGEGPIGQIHFKVHGTAADDLWIVGSQGSALHWDGSALVPTVTNTDVDTTNTPIVSVDATGPEPLLAGGAGSAVLMRWDGALWRDETPEFVPPLNGVCSDGTRQFAVGQQGTALSWTGTVWESDLNSLTFEDYHTCLVSPGGETWAVGGQITRRPLNAGVLAYSGLAGVAAPF